MRGQGWAAPPPGYKLQAEVLSLSGPKPPRQGGQATKHRRNRNKPIKVGLAGLGGAVGGDGGGLLTLILTGNV